MDIAVISYSYTGNNNLLAASVANGLQAKHIKVADQKPRTKGTIAMDMLFARMPKVQPVPDIVKQYDLILYFGPVWMGKVASPLRPYLNSLKTNPRKYGFFSISGGADGANPKLAGELLKRTGAQPILILDQHIKDLLPSNPRPTRQDTSAYQLNQENVYVLSDKVIKSIKSVIEFVIDT